VRDRRDERFDSFRARIVARRRRATTAANTRIVARRRRALAAATLGARGENASGTQCEVTLAWQPHADARELDQYDAHSARTTP